MLLSSEVCVLLMLIMAGPVKASEANFIFGGRDKMDHVIQERAKRSPATAVYKGMKAAETLLKGAVKDPVIPKYHRQLKYVKGGDLLQALTDFASISPTNVRQFHRSDATMYGQVGFVGDRTVIIRVEKSGKPMIKIFKTADANDQWSPRIIINYDTYHKRWLERHQLFSM